MRKPDIVKLPTSQMEVFMDFFGLEYERHGDIVKTIEALEEVPQKQWTKLKVDQDTRAAEKVDDDIVQVRLVKLGRADADTLPHPAPPQSLSTESAPGPEEPSVE